MQRTVLFFLSAFWLAQIEKFGKIYLVQSFVVYANLVFEKSLTPIYGLS